MTYKYNFFSMYAKMEQRGFSRAWIRQNLSEGMGIIPATLRRWEKLKLNDEYNLSKANIEYCCKFLNCKETQFINELEPVTA